MQSIIHCYSNAPYLGDYFPGLESIYKQNYRFLIDLNVSIIKFFWDALGIKTKLVLQSELGVIGKGHELIINICGRLGSETYLNLPVVEKYLDVERFRQSGIKFKHSNFHPPVYPQLWGEFIFNLSVLDMMLNCGEKSRDILYS